MLPPKEGKEEPEEWPRNVEKNYGLTTARIGVFKSRNVVATLLLKDHVKLNTALDYLNKLGIDRRNEQYLSIAMGGFNKGMTSSAGWCFYALCQQRSIYNTDVFTEVKDNSGKTIISIKPERTQVFSEQTVFIMDDMMGRCRKRNAYPEIEYTDSKARR